MRQEEKKDNLGLVVEMYVDAFSLKTKKQSSFTGYKATCCKKYAKQHRFCKRCPLLCFKKKQNI